MDLEKAIIKFKSFGIKIDEPIIRKAIEFAIKYHGSQKRASGELYYYHPLEVAEIIAEMRLDSDSIVTAILHDTIEDTELTLEEITEHFGTEIAKLVDGVTKLAKIKYTTDNLRQVENFRKLFLAMSDDIRVLLIKLADRLHNMRTIEFIKQPEKRHRIALETMEIYAPLAERIGAQQIKVELQDICFKILHPKIRESILNRFTNIEGNKGNIVEQIINELENSINKAGYKAKVSGRKKTAYSTWMKMKQKDVGLDQLSDIIAFRIIVKDLQDCYHVLGIIHTAYKMIPGNFQDFISTPKSNSYQSLHTVILGPLNYKIEIQIRTKKMHDIAELGIAAHWRYKQRHSDKTEDSQYTWIQELLSILKQTNNPEEFLQNTKLAMYYNQVFCFTPKGDLVAFPKGATTLDFAYSIHSDVGNSSIGAKVNGRVVPTNTILKNGDQVEIITSKNQTFSPSWEKFVVTAKARSDIRKAVKHQRQNQYIKLGRNIINQTLKTANISDHKEALNKACDFYQKTIDEFLFAIGDGSITREDALKQMKPKKNKLNSTLSLLGFGSRKSTKKDDNNNLVPIKGLISGMAVHYAKCCHPLPGDRIVGVIHTGNGVTIHTSDCEMLKNFASVPERTIDLTWDSNSSNIPFICRINVILLNVTSGLAELSGDISRNKGNIVNFKMISRSKKFFEMTFDIEVSSTDHIETIINSLRTKEIIQKVKRCKY